MKRRVYREPFHRPTKQANAASDGNNSSKWRPRLLDFVSALDYSVVKSASEKAFRSLPDISKAISDLTVLKGVGPATASAVVAAYAPEVAPFMSDEAMVAALGNSVDLSSTCYSANCKFWKST
ncbi:uncharacterized protein LOC125479175 isoform X2 [Pyrus x bretschneideri]|uniref:uncharacterized protein LOC125479175 isoform X2 n=1 Tax=Pyrus x bretschneideri TaxID=225117 RepID=UPI00202F5F88|nr:uncharacterized protein LOC125479175 isoform X2 [Pyrus x bretschneideri]